MAVQNFSFGAQIDAWVKETEARATAVFRQSSQDVFDKAQENAPHRDGFLKASLLVVLNQPIPPATRSSPNAGKSADAPREQFQPANITAVIASAKLGDTIAGGWTANYALPQEYGSRPHKIYPKDKLALHWRSPGGEGVFATVVDHPGNPPTAFVRRAVSQWQQIVDRAAARAKSRAGR